MANGVQSNPPESLAVEGLVSVCTLHAILNFAPTVAQSPVGAPALDLHAAVAHDR